MTNLTTRYPAPLSAHRAGWPVLAFLASAAVMLARGLTGDRVLPFLPAVRFSFFDLKIYREAAQVMLTGHPLYAAKFELGFGFTYPPVAALLFVGLAACPLRVDELAVSALNVGLVAVIAHLAIRLADGSSEETARPCPGSCAAWIAATLALWTEPVISAIGYGQIDLLIAALVLADLTLGRHARWGGLGIGAAAALKLTPLIFIAYLLLTHRVAMAGRALGGFGLAIGLSFAAESRNAWSYWGGALLDTSRVTGHRRFAGRGPADQSLRGAWMRLASGLPHLADVWLLSCMLVGAAGLWLAARAARRGDEARGFTLTAVTGLLICPVSWTHHWVIALPGVMLMIVSPRPGHAGRVCAAAAAVGAIASPLVWLEITRDPSGAHLGVAGLLLGDLYVLAGLGTILLAGRREWFASGSPGHPGGPLRALPTGQGTARPTQSLR